ncbi:glycerol kinase [bacterium SCSIO 12741]|nr:glycerol kinase [bacterium SCSIO 12741]
MKYLSTSALARKLGFESAELFAILKENGWIYRKEGQWQLTKEGRLAGGNVEYNPKYGEYVVWPSNLDIDADIDSSNTHNATTIGEFYSLSSRKINLYLSELGWIEKNAGGWTITKLGKKNGGHQFEAQNGTPYCIWNESILINPHLKRSIEIGEGIVETEEIDTNLGEEKDFREKYPAKKRTSDGHLVRSRGELLIDNFFYQNGIVHAYEKKVNIDEPMYCDFYLPQNKIYVEFWGMEDDPSYRQRKQKKLDLYSKYNFELIEINSADIDNLDEVLETKLRKKGITV